MFVVSDKIVIQWPATIKVAEDGGRQRERKFDLFFRRLDADAVDALNAQTEAQDGDGTDTQIEKQAQLFEGWVENWSGIQNPNGTQVEYLPDNLRNILRSHFGPAFMVGFYVALGEFRTGARAKN
jgi:hypothetical protein